MGDTESAKQIENNLPAKLLHTPPSQSLPNQNLMPTVHRAKTKGGLLVKARSGTPWMKTQFQQHFMTNEEVLNLLKYTVCNNF